MGKYKIEAAKAVPKNTFTAKPFTLNSEINAFNTAAEKAAKKPFSLNSMMGKYKIEAAKAVPKNTFTAKPFTLNSEINAFNTASNDAAKRAMIEAEKAVNQAEEAVEEAVQEAAAAKNEVKRSSENEITSAEKRVAVTEAEVAKATLQSAVATVIAETIAKETGNSRSGESAAAAMERSKVASFVSEDAEIAAAEEASAQIHKAYNNAKAEAEAEDAAKSRNTAEARRMTGSKSLRDNRLKRLAISVKAADAIDKWIVLAKEASAANKRLMEKRRARDLAEEKNSPNVGRAIAEEKEAGNIAEAARIKAFDEKERADYVQSNVAHEMDIILSRPYSELKPIRPSGSFSQNAKQTVKDILAISWEVAKIVGVIATIPVRFAVIMASIPFRGGRHMRYTCRRDRKRRTQCKHRKQCKRSRRSHRG